MESVDMIAEVEQKHFFPLLFMFLSLCLNVIDDFRPVFKMAVQIVRMVDMELFRHANLSLTFN
ncbi:hypothetical protein CHCC14810_3613 [Bacillus licheniformis]|nr:hypothetical protein CHCC20344_3576 [Bacillus licheniformis]TWL36246.1 hypothetical protein CHCC15543_1740 [Bacillus licheniformis]TWM65561.1 hypothetical protein CHCC14810_3613 [Bacillus licheniformis]